MIAVRTNPPKRRAGLFGQGLWVLVSVGLLALGCQDSGPQSKNLPSLPELAPQPIAVGSSPNAQVGPDNDTAAPGVPWRLGAAPGVVAAADPTADAPAGPAESPAERSGESLSPAAAIPAPTPPLLGSPAARPPTHALKHRVLIQRLIFARDDPKVAFALRLLDPPPIGRTALDIWRQNGFELVTIDRDRLTMLAANLPQPTGITVYRVGGGKNYSTVPLISDLPRNQRLKLVDAQGQSRIERISRGRYQLLVNLSPSVDGPDAPPTLDLLPQHHRPTVSLVPRAHQPQDLTGRTFDALHLLWALPEDRVLVVYAVPDDQAIAQATRTDEAASTEPAMRTARQLPGPLPLGRAMLTGQRDNQPAQIVLLITLHPLDQRLPNRQPR